VFLWGHCKQHTTLPFSHVIACIGKPAAGHVTASGSPATAEMGGILRITGSPERKQQQQVALDKEKEGQRL